MKKFYKKVLILYLVVTFGVIGRPLNRRRKSVNTLKQRRINGSLITCYTIKCSKNQFFKSCTEDLTDDTCHQCPPGTMNETPINSLDWGYSIEQGFCTALDCSCPPESVPDLNNTCSTTGIKNCVCNLADNQFGSDFQKCSSFEGVCYAGTELHQNGKCVSCKDGYFKSHDGKGLCIKHNKCLPPHLEVAFPGNATSDVICKPRLKNTSSTVIYPEYVSKTPVQANQYTDDPPERNTKSMIPTTTEETTTKGRGDSGDENQALAICLTVFGILILLLIMIIIFVALMRRRCNSGHHRRRSNFCSCFGSLDRIRRFLMSPIDSTRTQYELTQRQYYPVANDNDTHAKQYEREGYENEQSKNRNGRTSDHTHDANEAQTSFLSYSTDGNTDLSNGPNVDLLGSHESDDGRQKSTVDGDIHKEPAADEFQNKSTENSGKISKNTEKKEKPIPTLSVKPVRHESRNKKETTVEQSSDNVTAGGIVPSVEQEYNNVASHRMLPSFQPNSELSLSSAPPLSGFS